MSDNDLISRRALYEKTAKWEAQAFHMVKLHMCDDDKTEWRKWATVLAERSAFKYDVADAPAVPHEMTAREYLEIEIRMFKYYGLPYAFTVNDSLQLAEKFAREHPEGSNN